MNPSHPSANPSPVSRRELLKLAGVAAVTTVAGPAFAQTAEPSAPAQPSPPTPRKRVLRVAHLTDLHVQPERKAGEGLASCLKHMQSLKDKPEFVLTGGDTVMDSFGADEARTKLQWELWKKVFKDENGLPVQSCLGNHDIWGWNKKNSKTTGSEPNYGKKWAAEMFGVPKLHRSFDKAGWHFIILDSISPHGEDGYTAKLDDEQFEWLKGDLAAVKPETPVLVLSHIPIISAAALVNDTNSEKTGDWKVSGSLMHIDARKLKGLFYKQKNVKLCLSGHLHLVDRVDYLGTTYLCNGAVCGGWWKGNHQECEPGYAVLNLYSDGTFDHEYITYGWKAAEA